MQRKIKVLTWSARKACSYNNRRLSIYLRCEKKDHVKNTYREIDIKHYVVLTNENRIDHVKHNLNPNIARNSFRQKIRREITTKIKDPRETYNEHNKRILYVVYETIYCRVRRPRGSLNIQLRLRTTYRNQKKK